MEEVVEKINENQLKDSETSDLVPRYKRVGLKYKCGVCDNIFSSRRAVKHHTQAVHTGVRYFCAFCDKKFHYQQTLKSHVDHIHKGKTIRKKINDLCICFTCGKTFKTGVGLRLHKLAEHDGAIRHSCDKCGKLFKQKGNLMAHIQLLHEGKMFTCDICEYRSTKNRYLKKHIQKYHNSAQNQEKGDRNLFKESIDENINDYVPDKKILSVVTPLDDKPVDQDFGPQEKDPKARKRNVKDNRYYKKFKSVKVGDMYKCEVCDSLFKTAMGALSHRRAVHEEEKFDCHICYKQFSQQSNLKTHLQSKHENIKRFKCDLCNYRVKQNRTLKSHIQRLHTKQIKPDVTFNSNKGNFF